MPLGNVYSGFLYVDHSNIGFDLTSEMANFDTVCMQDPYSECNSRCVSVNVTSGFIDSVIQKMRTQGKHLNILTIILNVRNTIPLLGYSALQNGIPVNLVNNNSVYYSAMLNQGNAIYTDAKAADYYGQKIIYGSVKIEVRTFLNEDGSNWTYINTNPYGLRKLATHHSLTFGKPRSWLYPDDVSYNKCQDMSIQEQYRIGVRLFDFRIKSDKDNNICAAHSEILYDTDVNKELTFLNTKTDAIVWVRLETRKLIGMDQEDYAWFENVCNHFLTGYPHITFVGGTSIEYNDKLCHNMANEPNIVQYNLNYKPSIGNMSIRDLAAKYNPEYKKNINFIEWSMFDFVDESFSIY